MNINEVKVDMAVLPSCGLGSRLGDITKKHPKCLVSIDGEPLIERQIKQLKNAGIDNIVVMTGYLHEQLDYLKDKYSVKMIYNDEYATKNTIATFHKAIGEIRDKNVYITCTDLFYSENPFHATESDSFAAGSFKHDCTGEWVCNLDENDRIKEVIVDGFDDYYYTGLCFLNKEMVNALSELVEDYYGKEGNDQMYWEEAMVYNLDKLPPLYLRKFEYGMITEFDTPDDIEKYSDECNAIQRFSIIYGIEDHSLVKAQRTVQGMNNHTFKMDYDGKSYFFRVPGNKTEFFHNRAVEGAVYKVLSNYDVADEVLYYDAETGVKVAKYYHIARRVDISNENELRDSMKAYRRLHNIKGSIDNSCEIEDVFYDYLKKYESLGLQCNLEGFDDAMELCKRLADGFHSYKRRRVICHGDCSPVNIIYTEDGIKLIDFEFTGMADPLSDVAVFGIAAQFGVKETLNLYDYYRDAEGDFDDDEVFADDELNRKLIGDYMIVTCMSSVLWNLISKHTRQYDLDKYIDETYALLNRVIKEANERGYGFE